MLPAARSAHKPGCFANNPWSLSDGLCVLASLQKQMKFLEQQQEDNRSSKEEARRLRNKLKTMERGDPGPRRLGCVPLLSSKRKGGVLLCLLHLPAPHAGTAGPPYHVRLEAAALAFSPAFFPGSCSP